MEERIDSMTEDTIQSMDDKTSVKRKGLALQHKMYLLIIIPFIVATILLIVQSNGVIGKVADAATVGKMTKYIFGIMFAMMLVSCAFSRFIVWSMVKSLNRTIDVLQIAAN